MGLPGGTNPALMTRFGHAARLEFRSAQSPRDLPGTRLTEPAAGDCPGSFDLDACKTHYIAPLFGFVRDEPTEGGG
jgi:hypothetical protein